MSVDDQQSDDATSDESDGVDGSGGLRGLIRGAGGILGGAFRSSGSVADRAARSAQTARLVSSLEERVSQARRERKIGKGTLRATHIAAYRGFGSNGQASFIVRVAEEPVVPDAASVVADPKVVRTNLRRFVALALPGVHLHLLFRGNRADAHSDRHGYARGSVVTGDLDPDWYEYHCVTEPDDRSEVPQIVTGEFLVPDQRALAVVSDIDDTVLRTGLTEGFVAFKNTILRSPDSRRPVPGMATLYQGIREANGAEAAPSFFYVSTGPWNLYEMITDFLDARGFPKGVMFLTDWGPQDRYVMRSGKEHKRSTLARLFASYPRTSFLLIGDSGQNDPLVYIEAAREFPGRVKAIVILDVGDHMAERAEELRAQETELQSEGVPFHLVSDASEAAVVLAGYDIVNPALSDDVAAAVKREAVL